jgi:butyrate kinase
MALSSGENSSAAKITRSMAYQMAKKIGINNRNGEWRKAK